VQGSDPSRTTGPAPVPRHPMAAAGPAVAAQLEAPIAAGVAAGAEIPAKQIFTKEFENNSEHFASMTLNLYLRLKVV
jgi:hypothetical protein